MESSTIHYLIPRSIPILLQVLIDNIESLRTGLCYLTKELELRDIITPKERKILYLLIRDNDPVKNNMYYKWLYYFPIGNKEFRIKYLQDLIIKYK